MKRVIFLMIVILLGALYLNYDKDDKSENVSSSDSFLKGVFISYIDYASLKGKEVNEQKNIINEMVNNVSYFGFNTVILQVRAFSDAIYDSSYFPLSSVMAYDSEGVLFDVLSYFIEKCNNKDIVVYAWINPYRISSDGDTSKVSKSASYYKWLGTNKIGVYDDGIYFNPADSDVMELILNGVSEIVKNYRVAGVLYDDYFYPNDVIDVENYEDYGGSLSLDSYRINNINTLLKESYLRVKSINKDVLFGISPSGNVENNLNYEYLDVAGVLKDKYLDFIMPQLYYGFDNQNKPYMKVLKEWSGLNVNKIDLYVALSLYKAGMVDVYAGSGKDEWVYNRDIIKRQVLSSSVVNDYGGFVIFRYEYLFLVFDNDNLVSEVSGLQKIMNIK
jgi:uncharacterized lipoprotein YddW (UPF0748 family)